MNDTFIGVTIFVVTFTAIVTERLHKTIVALLGAALMIGLGVVTQEEAFHSLEYGVDHNVIFLLIGMMVVMNITRRSGLFQLLADWAVARSQARPFPLLALLCVITAVLSSLLPNVTTVLLMAAVTLEVSKRLQLDPVPMLLSEAMASNIGGMSTMIGDPPNLMIASKAALSYMDFLVVLAPAAMVLMALYLGGFWLLIGRRMPAHAPAAGRMVAANADVDTAFMLKCAGLLLLTTIGFACHETLHLKPATVALLGASLFMVVSYRHRTTGEEMDYLTDVEWKTILFLTGLFIVVGGFVKIGGVRYLSERLVALTHGHVFEPTVVVLWGSALLSAIIDNVPYVAAMNPLIVEYARSLHPQISDYTALVHQPDVLPLWWALALGACLGGNATVIGAAANVVVVDMARRGGHAISFGRFSMYGIPVTICSILIATGYLWIRFFA